jgi:hypothetical protein
MGIGGPDLGHFLPGWKHEAFSGQIHRQAKIAQGDHPQGEGDDGLANPNGDLQKRGSAELGLHPRETIAVPGRLVAAGRLSSEVVAMLEAALAEFRNGKGGS